MKTIRFRLSTLAAILFLSIIILLVGIANIETTEAQERSYVSKTGSSLEFLIKLANEEPRLSGTLGAVVSSATRTRNLNVSIRFDHVLSEAEILELEAQGLTFVRVNREVAHSGTIYGAELPIYLLDILKERPDLQRIESTWKPAVHTPLNISVPEIRADYMWQLLDSGGDNITGDGLIVADFDTGIDVFHPDFWKGNGGSYSWIDDNSNGMFDPGLDYVDLNDNSNADTGEILDFFDAQGPAGNNDGVFQADMDWLYNDADGDGQRDFGTGFTEADPTFGEWLFIVDDTNSNNALDVGEDLIGLGMSKVLRTLNTSGTERVRGTDLISTDDDTNGHGTGVCGILNGGIIGTRKYVGVAPDAELLVANRRANDFTVYIPWAAANGADVMLYEFGGWVQEFLDGSSNVEQAIDAQAAAGIIQVVPAGNLGNKNKHAQDDVAATGNTSFTFNVPSTDNPGTVPNEDIEAVWITALWRDTGNNLSFDLTTPTPTLVNLPASPPAGWNSTTVDGHTVFYRREDSTRGTAKYDITIQRNDVFLRGWTLRVNNTTGSSEHVDMYIADDRTAWSGGARWTAFQSNDNTVTTPATADSAITVASYSTRGGTAGALSNFSPAGPRIDGQAIMDIAAPGNFDIGSALSKDSGGGTSLGGYQWFSGTSAAGPHVASGSALLLQWDPTLTHNQIKTMLQQGARSDAFTGGTPNDDWGHGKLDLQQIVNEPPVCNANDPYEAECQYPNTQIMLDGSGSTDPNSGDILSYSWSTDCPGGSLNDPTSPIPTLSVGSGCFDCDVSLTVTDLAGETDSCSAPVTVSDTLDPVLTCPVDITIECDEETTPDVTGQATATDSCDSSPEVTYSDVVAPGSCPAESTITRTWTAADACGNSTSCEQVITIADTTVPVITSFTAHPDVLWPPNHKMTPITTEVDVFDNCDEEPVCLITAVSSNESENGLGDGNTPQDWQITGDLTVNLRAERSGTGGGRVYTIMVECTDACGNSSTETTDVTVLHDKRR